MQKTHPDQYPVVRLKIGGFNHRDDRVGWVATPVLAVVGRVPKDSAAKPDSSPTADMNDQFRFDHQTHRRHRANAAPYGGANDAK